MRNEQRCLWYNMLMAEHKVPQDVEADDKLLGPFSFRQFVYLMVAAAAGFLAFLMGGVAIPLAFIPAPVCLFFLIIALPLRKDQPTEIYMAALIKYYFKPRVRMWQADGEQPLVEISNPTTDDTPRTKDLAGDEVSRRLSFLANLSDTQGWSTRGINAPVNNTNLTDEFAGDAINAQDVMEDSELSNSIDNLLDKSERQVRQNAIDQMNRAVQQQQQSQQAATTATPFQPISATVPQYHPTAPQPAQPAPAPNLNATANLPTYDYNSVVQPAMPSPNLQAQTPQPMHNQRMQAYNQQMATSAAYMMPQQMMQQSVYQQPVAQPVPQPQVNYQPTQSVQQQAPVTAQASVSQPMQPATLLAAPVATPNVTAPAKPAIMNNDNVYHQPTLNSPAGDESAIDIKLH